MEQIKKHWKLITSGVCLVAGILVSVFGDQTLGYALLGASGIPIVLPLAKKKIIPMLLVCALALPMVGCKSHMINVDAFGPGLEQVLDRHDAYVKADGSLDSFFRDLYLRTTELLRAIVAEAKK